MKLWKSKKPIGCVPGKSAALKCEDAGAGNGVTGKQPHQDGTNGGGGGIALVPMLSVDRAMSPAQSEDSGLAPERGTTYATITLPRDNALNLGITFAERNDLSYPPVIGSLSPLGHAADFLAPGDRLHQIDGVSTIGLSNQQIMSMLCLGSAAGVAGDAGPAVIEIEYSLPEYISQNSLCVTSKLAQITVERESGCLGLTLRGGGDFPLIVTHVRPHGPVYKTGRIKPGDRLLRVDNVSLIGKTLAEAQQIIKCGGHMVGYTNLTIEYDVSVVQSVEFSLGPLLIEIERPMNDKLGLVLCNYSATGGAPIDGHSKPTSSSSLDELGAVGGVYIASILPASIADRCGALGVGDQVLSIDDTVIESGAYSPDEVMTMLDTSTGRGYTQMQIMPAHALARRGYAMLGSPKYNFSTLESRKSTRQRPRFVRKSSLPLEANNAGSGSGGGGGGGSGGCGAGPSSTSTSGSSSGVSAGANVNVSAMQHSTSMALCRAESFPVLLDCSQGAGILLGAPTSCGRAVIIAQILPDSVAERSGCIQKGDRIIAINKMYNLDLATMRQLLDGGGGGGGAINGAGCRPTTGAANWLELEIEFDMPDAVVPSSGVFNVKLLRSAKSGLGISAANGTSHSGLVIADVKLGSPAHRTGSLRVGDLLLAVDNHPVQHFNVDSLLKEGATSSEYTTLTIKRVVLPDFLFDAQQKMPNPIYSNCPASSPNANSDHELYSSLFVASKYAEVKYNDCISMKSTTPQPEYFRGPSMDESSLQSVQLRHHCGNNVWANAVNANTAMGRSFAAPNTQSLTTELPEEESAAVAAAAVIQQQQQHQQHQHHRHQQQQQQQQQHYDDFPGYELNRYASVDCTALPPPMENKVYGSAASSSSKSSGSSLHQIIFTVRLEPKGGLLGITLAGSEDITKAITISGIVEGGIAHKNGQIQVGDQLLAIDDHSVQGIRLSHATGMLQHLGDVVDLKILRTHDMTNGIGCGSNIGHSAIAGGHETNMPQPQAIYAKVQRRPRSPSQSNTDASGSGCGSGSGKENGNGGGGGGSGKHRVFHVTLYKDKVYDDYGFSVSDGLYERGVFINRIRTGGPADMCGLLKPFDRIMQVNEMKTQDFDCCLTVPLIAAAGDKIEMIIQRTE